MKLVKMSLAAAVLMGASAYAIDNIKVNGDAKLYYSTDNVKSTSANNGLFGQNNSVGDTELRLGVTGDLTKNVSFGVTGYAVSTLGIENNMVHQTWSGAHGSHNGVTDEAWLGEMWIAGTAGKTTAKAGRMELDTPFVFSEKWSVTPNTFSGAVLINKDLPDTTLVAAWVGKGNGLNAGKLGYDNNATIGYDYMGKGAEFGTFGKRGAYAVAAINNSFKPLVAQAWYYDVMDIADAYWLQADWDCQLIKDVKVGAQYASIDPKAAGNSVSTQNTQGYAVKLGYEGIKNLKVSAAYSSVGKEGGFRIANVATDNAGSYGNGNAQFAAGSKLYTEAWWNFGYVGRPGAKAVNLTAEYDAGFAKLGAYYTDVVVKPTGGTNAAVTEATLTATKSFGPLDATLAYISTDDQGNNSTSNQYDTVQAYLTLNF